MYKLASKLISFFSLNFLTASVALADNCSGGVDCLQTAGYNAGVAVAGGAVGVATLIISRSFKDDGLIDGDVEGEGGDDDGLIDGDVEGDGGDDDGLIDGDVEGDGGDDDKTGGDKDGVAIASSKDIFGPGDGDSTGGTDSKPTDSSDRPKKFVDRPLGLPEKGAEGTPEDGSSSSTGKKGGSDSDNKDK